MRALAFTAATAAAFGAPPAAAQPRYDASRIAGEFQRQCVEGAFSGVVVVRVRGQEVFAAACGEADLVNRIANTRATRFKIYSTSKFVTALAVMRLVEDGRLDLDAPLSRYVAEAPAAWREVTLRQLLNHTSGVKDLTPQLVEAFRRDWRSAMEETLRTLSPDEAAMDRPPGSAFAYNNFGFELLALAAERAAGRPFPAVVQTEVFDRAGMKTASFQPPAVEMGHLVDNPEEGLALGYNGRPGALSQATNWAFVQMGAGAIRASVEDFVALDAALAEGRVLRPASLEEMQQAPVRPASGPPGRLFGLGLQIDEAAPVRMEGHTGGTNGYISDFQRYPDDGAMMIALTNRGFAKTKWLREGVAEMLKAAR